jgi:hypothetical protein
MKNRDILLCAQLFGNDIMMISRKIITFVGNKIQHKHLLTYVVYCRSCKNGRADI